jgi:glycosyltransferase involved in cell wall biosynthesis
VTRVLLVCPEPLTHGQPAGIGIRFLEIAKALSDDGHRVTTLSRDGGELDVTPENIARFSADADMAFAQGHVANDLFAHARPIPTVVDLYDPFIVENLHYYETRGAEVFTHDHATLINSLLRGDFFLCASDAQRLFWLGMLMAVGRLNPIAFEDDRRLASLIAVAPFGVQPPRPNAQRNTSHDVLFGGIYDWYDPILAIDAIALARQTIADITLTFTTHPNPSLTPQGKTGAAMSYVKRHGFGDFIRFEPWAAYDERAAFFERFALALLTFPQSLETDLSMRTRIYDYLWGGLPIVTSSAPGTDELLARYGAGIVVVAASVAAGAPPAAPDIYAAALINALNPNHEQLFAATQRFVAEHQWPRVLEPLLEFCRAPHYGAGKEEFATRPQLPERPASMLDRIKRRIGGSF